MILEDFITLTSTGLYCSYGNFYLDPQQAVQYAVISHAHGDHAVSGNQEVFCTAPTAAFMKHRYKKFAANNFHLKEYKQVFEVNDVKVSFHSAGHILGSAQVLMEYKGVKYLYTGDFKIEEDHTCEAFDFIEADVFITETTFANPNTKHPDAQKEIEKLNGTDSNIMLGSYALGKSQRLVQMINKFCPNKHIMLHHNIIPFMKIYEDFGVKLGSYSVYDRKVMKQNQQNQIYIVPPMVYHSYHKAINVVRAFASGWSNLQERNGISVYISDHADWDAILLTIDRVKPKQIWTLHGDGKYLKDYLKGKIEVKILN